MQIVLSILPIVLTLLIGFLFKQRKILPEGSWGGIETLSFRLLIPVLIVKSIVLARFDLAEFAPMIGAMIGALTIGGAILIGFRFALSQGTFPNPKFTTLFQTTTRWNAFIALAAAEFFVGPEGVTMLALGMAALVPLINVANIVVLAAYGSATPTLRNVVKTVLQNPLVQACILGLALNFAQVPMPEWALQTLDLLARASIAIGLLAVGAGMDLRRLIGARGMVWAGVASRLVVVPCAFFALALLVGLDRTQMLAGYLMVGVPAATNGYIVAKQMGGDAELYVDILSWQTLLSMVLLPIVAISL